MGSPTDRADALTDARVHGTFADASLEKAGASVAANRTVVLAGATITADATDKRW